MAKQPGCWSVDECMAAISPGSESLEVLNATMGFVRWPLCDGGVCGGQGQLCGASGTATYKRDVLDQWHVARREDPAAGKAAEAVGVLRFMLSSWKKMMRQGGLEPRPRKLWSLWRSDRPRGLTHTVKHTQLDQPTWARARAKAIAVVRRESAAIVTTETIAILDRTTGESADRWHENSKPDKIFTILLGEIRSSEEDFRATTSVTSGVVSRGLET